MRKFFLTIILFLLFVQLAKAQSSYTWTGNIDSDWGKDGNWNIEIGSDPSQNSKYIFPDLNKELVVTNIPSISIGELSVYDNCKVKFDNGNQAVHLKIINSGRSLLIGSGASLIIDSNSPFVLELLGQAEGEIGGEITFKNTHQATNYDHRLLGNKENALVFRPGSKLIQEDGTKGHIFGDSDYSNVQKIVQFDNGSSFIYKAGGNPFGNSTDNKVSFLSESNYIHQSAIDPSLKGRRYGNFIFDKANTTLALDNNIVTNISVEVEEFEIRNGIVRIAPGASTYIDFKINGDLIVSPSASLIFADTAKGNSEFVFKGTSAQKIIGNAAIGKLKISNVKSVFAHSNLTIFRGIEFAIGKLICEEEGKVIFEEGVNTPNVVGSGPLSFIDGPVIKKFISNSQSFRFPTGHSEYSGFAEIRPYTSSVIEVRYFREQSSHYTNDQAFLDNLLKVSQLEYWKIGSNATISADLSFSYSKSSGVSNPLGIRVAQWEDDEWKNKGPLIGPSESEGFLKTTAPLPPIAEFTFGSVDDVNGLPVVFTSFESKNKSSAPELSWTSIFQEDCENYEIQRSEDGISFKTVGIVFPNSFSRQQDEYTYPLDIDLTPAYFRIKQNDKNGFWALSKILYASNPLSKINIYPNPVPSGSVIHIISPTPALALCEVWALSGRRLFSSSGKVDELSKSITNFFARIGPGLYILKTRNENAIEVLKLIKE